MINFLENNLIGASMVILLLGAIFYFIYTKYNMLFLLKTLLKLLFIIVNMKIILFFIFAFKVIYLTPFIITLIFYINLHICSTILQVKFSTNTIIKRLITMFIVSCLICIIKHHLVGIIIDYNEINFIIYTLLNVVFIKDAVLYGDDFSINSVNSSRLFSNNTESSSTGDATPTRGRSPERDSSSTGDNTPTRGRSPNNSNYNARSISPRSLSSIIDDSYTEAKQGIMRFFGSTFYIWDKSGSSEITKPRFRGAIQEVDTNDHDKFKDDNGRTWSNPNGTNYTNQDELRSVINLRRLATTPSEKNNLEKAISSVGGPIMFTEDTDGNLIFFRLQQ